MMAEAGITFDFEEAFKRLDGLAAIAKEHLPRSMLVAAGKVVRDEAKARAPVKDGTLREAIYLAFSENRSYPEAGQFTYSVTWNAAKAPHGHLLEFGHWRTHAVYLGKDGNWYSDPKRPLDNPKWVPAHSFLRPAYDAVISIALQAGLDRGRERMAEILADPKILEQYANGSGSGTVQPTEIAG